MLGISSSQLYVFVNKGWLKRYGPPGRKHLFYKLSEVEALIAARSTFDEYQEALPSSFEQAKQEDLQKIIEIAEQTFHLGLFQAAFPLWYSVNPESFFVLRDERGQITGFLCIIALSPEVLTRFIHDEIGIDQIEATDIALFLPGEKINLYVIALCIDPVFRTKLKHEYGARLMRGLFALLLELGQKGVEIDTITARTHKPDGLRLLRKMGVPQLRSPVPGKYLFSVKVSESGYPLLVRYSELLEEWKQEHAS